MRARDARSTSTCWPRPSRCSRCPTATSACAATSTRASRTACPAPTSTRFYETAPAAVRRGRLRLPRGRPDGRQRHQRQAHPAAGRRRAVRRPLRRAAAPRARARPARRHPRAASVEWTLAGRQAACACARRGWSRSPSARSPRSRYEVEPVDERAARRRAVRAGRQRGRCRRCTERPAGRRRARRRRWRPRSTTPTARRAVLVHRTKRSGLRMAAGMDHVDRGARPGRRCDDRRPRRLGPHHGRLPTSQPGERAAGRQVPRLRLVEPALAAGACATRSTAALAGARLHRLGRAARASSATTSTTSGTAPTSRSRATRSSSRRCASRSSTCCRPAPAPSSGAIPAKGLTGPGYDGHAFWDTETLRAAGAHLHRARRRRRRAALAPLDARPAPASAPQQLGLRGAAFPWRTIRGAGVLGATGRPAPPPSTSTPTSPTPSIRYVAATGDDGVRARTSALELLVETARLWRVARPPRRRTGASTSTASPAPTSTRAVADDNVYTNLMAARNLRAAAERVRPPPRARPRELGVDDEETAAWRDAADADARARTTRTLGVHPQSRGLHRARRRGTSSARRRTSTRCCCTSRTSTSTASRWSSRPTWCWRCTGAATRSRRSRRRATSTTTSALHRARLVAVGVHPGGDGGRGRPPRAGLRLRRRGGADRPARPARQHPRRAAHGLAGRRLDARWSPASAACRPRRGPPPASTRSCRRDDRGWRSAFHWRGMRVRVEVDRSGGQRRAARDGDDAEMDLLIAGEQVRLTAAEPVVRPWTAARRRCPVRPSHRAGSPTRGSSRARRAPAPARLPAAPRPCRARRAPAARRAAPASQRRNPCAVRQPSRRSVAACSAVSTPSAIDVEAERVRPGSTIASDERRRRRRRRRCPSTKLRSIFRTSTGKRRR